MPNVIDDFATPATPAKVEHTYTATHPAVKDGNVTLQGCKRDADGASFVSKQTGPDGKVRYHAAGTVTRYLQLLAQLPADDADDADDADADE